MYCCVYLFLNGMNIVRKSFLHFSSNLDEVFKSKALKAKFFKDTKDMTTMKIQEMLLSNLSLSSHEKLALEIRAFSPLFTILNPNKKDEK